MKHEETGEKAYRQTETHIAAAEFAEKYRSGRLSDEGAQIVDVREPEEWDVYHLKKSRLIPLGELPGRIGETDREQTVYVVCAHGIRSLHAAHFLRRQGFGCVVNVDGGLAEVSLHLDESEWK